VSEEADPEAFRLEEPLSSEQAVLRTSLLEGLTASALRNVDAGNEGVALFELAHVYLPSGGQLPDERWHLGGILQGGYTVARGAVEALYEALAVPVALDPPHALPPTPPRPPPPHPR